ncbi:hypothetical protein PsorP6_006248 [Peronosclerospora sorghi]|uniref:Uncharacterized protein n=1 Tax=Peronosclerospora sorghi TaxID=230839 RepID=A0ACC0W2V7_9STRA|nr:hypothetical protein PsorP6_006248 [Peronosclerospora sorghi]
MVTTTRANASAAPTDQQPSTQRSGPKPPPRLVPDDSLFQASLLRLHDSHSSDVDRRFAALASLPTPVAPELCKRMWIPASRLTAEHNIQEILESLATDNQPDVWKTSRSHLRDFTRIPNQGISFVCTSDDALRRLGGVQLQICESTVTIRKYSGYDKLYYVDLQRLPSDVSDPSIYDWFVTRGVIPTLITPTYAHGELKSRARTVYFNSVVCPECLFEPNGDPLRAIHFIEGEKPCFVRHRQRKFNQVQPPSLRPPQRRPSDISDDSMKSLAAEPRQAVPASTPTPDAPSQDTSTPPDIVVSSTYPRRPSSPQQKSFILGSVHTDEPAWKLVQHSQYGVINRDGPKFITPENGQPCELTTAVNDPHALVYQIPIAPNMYDILQDEGFDSSLPPDVDLYPGVFEEGAEAPLPISGFMADSSLLPLANSVRTLQDARKLPIKVEQVTPTELQHIIDDYLSSEWVNFRSHDDVLAAVQVQPSYFRRAFTLPRAHQERLFQTHAIYRAINAEPLQQDECQDFLGRLRTRLNIDPSDMVSTFVRLFPDTNTQAAAINSALSDLFLMIFAPSIYFDPVKLQALLPELLPPKRIRLAPFLLWSDLNLVHIARTDVSQIFMGDKRTPPHVVTAMRYLSQAELPPSLEIGPSRLVCPRL